ncbi:MAG: hypothetical protein JSS24_12775 [Proteobacteria bacterium]|nr:hypothetical protein [Pseudomonadota bacterium]
MSPSVLHASTAPSRPYLAFFRAGNRSLHPRQLQQDPHRNWDCCVSWYTPPVPGPPVEYSCEGGDNKLEGFLEFRKLVDARLPYRQVLLIDDDICFRPGDISRYFELCERHQLYLSQPALYWSTHYNLNVTLANPACIVRRVSFIEIMAPCLSAAALGDLIDTFDATRSTWGVDFIWCGRAYGKKPVHVVDAIRIEHTKPMDKQGGAFYRKMKAQGVDPAAELAAARAAYPALRRMRTERDGHVYVPGLPGWLCRPALLMFEKLKFLARQRKKVVRWVHSRRNRG